MVTSTSVWKPLTYANVIATDDQFDPAMVSIGNDRYVVLWEDNDLTYTLNGGFNLVGQVFDAEGNLVQDPFQVNRSGAPGLDEEQASAVSRPGGGFGVVFHEQGTGISQIVVDFFNKNAGHIGGTVIQPDEVSDTFSRPSLAMRTDGSYLVTYLRYDGTYDVVARLVSKTGHIGSEFTVFDSTNTAETSVEAATLSNGSYVVAYEQYNSGSGESDPEVMIRKTNGDRVTVRPSESLNDQTDLQVAALKGGGFVVAWTTDDDGDGSGIRYSVYSNSGATVKGGTQFGDGVAANTTTTGDQVAPDVTALKDGGFFIVWRDGDAMSGQRFDAKGNKVGLAFLVGNEAHNPTAATLDDGRILAGFNDLHGTENDSDVFAGIYDPRGMTIYGTNGNDVITGRKAVSIINGKNGNDTLLGQANNDTLNGGNGRDILHGGLGKDRLNGGAGPDRFQFKAFNETAVGANRDVIVGFSHKEHDKIDLGLIGDSVTDGHPGLVFIGYKGFAAYHAAHPNVFGMVRYQHGNVQINVDTNLHVDAEIHVGVAKLFASDFTLLAP